MRDSGGAENMEKTLIVACILAFNEEKMICGVVVRAKRYVDRVVFCDEEYIVGWYMNLIFRPSFLLGEGYVRG